MPNYRRCYIPNTDIFITVVTYNRNPLFKYKKNIGLFFETLNNVQRIYSFEIYANVLLPDHFHWILRLAESNENFLNIIHSFKRNFTLNYKKANQINIHLAIWQKRFWDHVIRDEEDLKNHLDYIHWNPVKHNLVSRPNQYEYSSYSRFVDEGVYPQDWCSNHKPETILDMDFE